MSGEIIDIKETIRGIGERARRASYSIGILSFEDRKKGLSAAADSISKNKDLILEANKRDVEKARNKLSPAMLDRLSLDEKKISGIVEGIRQLIEIESDPIGEVMDSFVRPNGLLIKQVRVPLGVLGIIYESRPNVTADAFALCFLSGNVCILRGGSDSLESNRAISRYLIEGLENAGLPRDALLFIDDASHSSVDELVHLNGLIDAIIPRGGAGLIQSVLRNSTVPVIETGVGNCHIYIDEFADSDMAVSIVDNAKTQRMGVCNAAESLVVHESVVDTILPQISEVLSGKGIELRGDERVMKAIETSKAANEEDWGREYLGPIISIKTVNSLDQAIEHINKYTTHHSEAIITSDKKRAERFMKEVDAACVYVNASTRFTDGFEFGFGAEIGISTQKLHARGPMGLKALTSYKYQIYGNGQIRG
ncbi:MAG: glutamate-5-semialdehyde dehydrogenase [Lachnospiraceae bacterium]|nr:glutamate-5-semialdehyde dehydrogenase [Lachnospiraceae bacterium]